MRKTKSEAHWNKLTPEQREILDRWLFEERQSYAAIFPRARDELGFKGSISSLQRYYARRDKERVTTEFTELRDELAALSGAPTDAAALWAASKKLLGRFLYLQMRKTPGNVKEWVPVAGLMVDNDRNELLRELKGNELKMREKVLEFAKEKFQVDMVEQALGVLPDLLDLERARRAAVPNAYVENAHLNRARRKMFGVVWEVRPESPEEEAAMLAARKQREAEEAQGTERQQEGEKITVPEPPTPGSPYYQEYLEWKAKRESERQEAERPPGMGEHENIEL